MIENVILFDDEKYLDFQPLTLTRPLCELRFGIETIRQKWHRFFPKPIYFHTAPHLQAKYPLQYADMNMLINGRVCPSPELWQTLEKLPINRVLVQGDLVIALKVSPEHAEQFFGKKLPTTIAPIECDLPLLVIENVWDLFKKNKAAIEQDFQRLTDGKISQPLSDSCRVVGDPNLVFLEEGAVAECAIFNTNNGPVYLGKNSEVMEGAVIRGPFALCEGAKVKLSGKIYGPTTIGPYSKVGGEINNSVILGYSNKGHDGFLGNSVLGEWCNLGADTNNSNLKNNYAPVKLWNYGAKRFLDTGLQFCGLIMGDHSKCGINTMFNTGTVVGVSANIYGGDFPRQFIPSFVWGGSKGYSTYRFDKAMATADVVMKRRNKELSGIDEAILKAVFEQSAAFRTWEKKA